MRVFVIAKWSEKEKRSELDDIVELYKEIVGEDDFLRAVWMYLRIVSEIYELGSNWQANWGDIFSEKLSKLFVMVSPRVDRDDQMKALRNGDFELVSVPSREVMRLYRFYLEGYRDGVSCAYRKLSAMTLGEVVRELSGVRV